MKVRNLNEYKLGKILTESAEAGVHYDEFYKELSITRANDAYVSHLLQERRKKEHAEQETIQDPFYKNLKYVQIDEQYLSQLWSKKKTAILTKAMNEESEHDAFYQELAYTKINDEYISYLCREKMSDLLTKAVNAEGAYDTFYKGLGSPAKVDNDYMTRLFLNMRNRRKAKYKRLRNVVAILASVFVLSSAMTIATDGDFANAVKGAFSQLIREDDKQFLVIKNQGISEIDSAPEKCFKIDKWSKVLSVKETTFPDLYLLNYLPSGYVFDNLFIDKVNKHYSYEYSFINKNNKINIYQLWIEDSSDAFTSVANYKDKMFIDDNIIYINEGSIEKNLVYTYFIGNYKFSIVTPITLDRNETENIIKNMKK